MNAPDAPLPDSRPLLERILYHLDERLNPTDTHLMVAAIREDRYRGMIDRCQRGVVDHAWDKLPMPRFPDWPMVHFPDELSVYVPIVEFGFWEGLAELKSACAKLESIVGKSEYTLDEIVQYRDCEAERIAAMKKTSLPFRMLRLRVLEKLGQLESVQAKPIGTSIPANGAREFPTNPVEEWALARQREALASHPNGDGPRPPNHFAIGDKLAVLPPIAYKLVECLWGSPNKTAAIDDVCERVWGRDDADRSALPSARTAANNALIETPWQVSIKAGFVILSDD